MAARHWPLTRFSLGSTPRNNGPRGDCQRHREEHRYRSQVTSIRSSERGRQPQKRQCNQPCARANDVENHLDARPGKDETGDCYSAQTDHVARDENGEVVVDQYLCRWGGAPVAMSAIRSSQSIARTPRRRGPSTPRPPPVSFHTLLFPRQKVSLHTLSFSRQN